MPPRQRGRPLIAALRGGDVEILGLIPGASNETYLCTVTAEETSLAVYKPQAGETPLGDFPDGTLYLREAAAAVLDDVLGWGVVPPTIVREDLPLGPGSLQAYVEPVRSPEVAQEEGVLETVDLFPVDSVPEDYAAIFAAMLQDGTRVILAHALDERVRRVALFDLLANNADRKGSHLIVGSTHPELPPLLHGIDHGLTFHAEPKVRTVLWGFAGQALSERERSDLDSAASRAGDALERYLSAAERDALRGRFEALAQQGTFPDPPENRTAIPWPPL